MIYGQDILVKFLKTQGEMDIFQCVSPCQENTFYARLPRDNETVRWYKAEKRQLSNIFRPWLEETEIFVPGEPVRPGTVMQPIADDGRKFRSEAVFNVNYVDSDTFSYIRIPSSRIALETLADDVAGSKKLKDYAVWKSWLLESKGAEYRGMPDNEWLWCHNDLISCNQASYLQGIDFMLNGQKYFLLETEYRHRHCGKTWVSVEIKTPESSRNSIVCGYAYNEEMSETV